MTLRISQVRDWKLDGLVNTAAGLRSGAEQMSQGGLAVINGLAGIDTDWQGESRDAAVVRSKDATGMLQQKAERWHNAAAVLDRGAQQLGLLRTAILYKVDDPDNVRMYLIGDDGSVQLTKEYAATLQNEAQQQRAEASRALLETQLRSLLATAQLCAQQYDEATTAALVGSEWYSRGFFPGAAAPPTGPIENANANGSGPDQYGTYHPGTLGKMGLQGTQLWAEGLVEGARIAGNKFAPDALEHFLQGSGTPMTVPVDNMLYDMPWFRAATQAQTRQAVETAVGAMPAGYNGPVAFQTGYANVKPDGTPARPDSSSNPDWWATLGTFSYQSSGIATPSGDGHYGIAARTSIYDYYNFDSTDRHPWPQASDLNDLHRAAWAQNFTTTGTSSTYTSTWP